MLRNLCGLIHLMKSVFPFSYIDAINNMIGTKNIIFIFSQEIKANSIFAMNIIFKLPEYDPPLVMRFNAVKFEKINNTIMNFAVIISYIFFIWKNFDVTIVAKI